MRTVETLALIDIEPQTGLANFKLEGDFTTGILLGIIVGIIIGRVVL